VRVKPKEGLTLFRLLAGLELPRVELGSGPTPVRELTALGDEAGRAPVWIKDDGAFSELGGNKARKLEWLLGEARRRRSRTVITGGALGTNHGLTTALAARELGMRAVVVLVPQPVDEHVRAQLRRLEASGAELPRAGGVRRGVARAVLLLAREALAGRRPYPIPPGGSVPRGCVGYVEAAFELAEQVRAGDIPEPSHAVVALGSGGTAAGLLLGLRLAGLRTRLVPVLVTDLIKLDARSVAKLGARTARFLARNGASVGEPPTERDVTVEVAWLGAGYGHRTPEGIAAIELLRDREGVRLEPVYTAKAVAALLALNREGRFGDGPVLYWHTYRPAT
jgi:D-cysteine desulfhydrase